MLKRLRSAATAATVSVLASTGALAQSPNAGRIEPLRIDAPHITVQNGLPVCEFPKVSAQVLGVILPTVASNRPNTPIMAIKGAEDFVFLWNTGNPNQPGFKTMPRAADQDWPLRGALSDAPPKFGLAVLNEVASRVRQFRAACERAKPTPPSVAPEQRARVG